MTRNQREPQIRIWLDVGVRGGSLEGRVVECAYVSIGVWIPEHSLRYIAIAFLPA